jgi:hypothetical protein
MTTTASREAIARETAKAVVFELNRVERTKQWLSVKTGIPYSTLGRKLLGQTELTFSDLALIADALGVEPSAFTPPPFRAERAA